MIWLWTWVHQCTQYFLLTIATFSSPALIYHPSSPLLKSFRIEYRSSVSSTAWPLTAKRLGYIISNALQKKEAQQTLGLKYSTNLLLQVEVTKFLGVHIDSSLSFAIHVSYIRAIILRLISVINRVNYFLPPGILDTLFYSFIYPYISYCGSVWGNTCPSVTNKSKSAQNPAVKAVFRLPRLYPTQDLYSNFGVIPFEQIIKQLSLSLAYSAYHKNLPPQLLSYFNSDNSEGLCLRSSNRSFIVPKCVSSSAQRYPIYKSMLQWNIIPFSVELSTSFCTLYNNVLKFDIIFL